jgi:hypothetical protein
MAYNTGWVRFIGCRLDKYLTWFVDDFWGLPLRDEIARGRCIVSSAGISSCGMRGLLEEIINRLVRTENTGSGWLNGLFDAINKLLGILDRIIGLIIDILRAMIYIIKLLILLVLAVLGLLKLLLSIVFTLFELLGSFFVALQEAVTSDTSVAIPIPSSPEDPLYNITVGLQLLNQTIGGTIIFTIVVLAIAVGSVAILIWTVKKLGNAL